MYISAAYSFCFIHSGKCGGGGCKLFLLLPSVRQEVDFDVRVPGSAIFPGWQVLGAEDGDNELMAHLVIPQFDLQGAEGSRHFRVSEC